MIRLLTTAARVAGLTYTLLSTSVLIGLLVHGTIKHVRKHQGK